MKVSAFIWGAALMKGIKFQSNSPADLLYLLKRAIQRRGDDAKPKLAITSDMLLKITATLKSTISTRVFFRSRTMVSFVVCGNAPGIGDSATKMGGCLFSLVAVWKRGSAFAHADRAKSELHTGLQEPHE